jgi:hypothetical protein
MPIVLLALMIVIPALLILGRFIVGALWVLLKVIALTIKSEIEEHKIQRQGEQS